MSLLELCCHVDEFWKAFGPVWREMQVRSELRQRTGPLRNLMDW
jgi:hypothetical protein